MNVPIVEQIAEKIKAAIESVTVANNYNADVVEVIRPGPFGVPKNPPDHAVVMTQQDEDREDELGTAGSPPAVAKIQVWTLDLVIRVSELGETPFDTIANTFEADVVKAVMADEQWDTLAISSQMLPPEFMQDPDGTYAGRTLFLEVHYRVAQDDPYTKV